MLSTLWSVEHADWESRWQEGQTAFHQAEATGLLVDHAERVWGQEGPGRIYVPLCGKSLDLVFLAQSASEVLGVEFVEQAVEEFFSERELVPDVVPGPPVRYQAGPYTLFAADFFSVMGEHTGPIDAIFDRAALVALDRETRTRYAEHLHALLRPGGSMLLITFDYDPSELDGPPFAVSEDEVERLLGDRFDIERLESRDALGPIFRSRGLTAITETAFHLVRS